MNFISFVFHRLEHTESIHDYDYDYDYAYDDDGDSTNANTVPKCSEENGDFVADTPVSLLYEDKTDSGNIVCPIDLDTCPTHEGLDPIHNFMSSTSHDCCIFHFTEGQVQRMVSQWEIYRLGQSIGIGDEEKQDKSGAGIQFPAYIINTLLAFHFIYITLFLNNLL